MYYDEKAVHVSFEAGITLPGGGTAQTVALAGADDNVSQIGGVQKVNEIELSNYGVKLTREGITILVPWSKVRQCRILRTPLSPAKAYAGAGDAQSVSKVIGLVQKTIDAVDSQYIPDGPLPLFQKDGPAARQTVEIPPEHVKVIEASPAKTINVRIDPKAK